jgi:hypothetical protein
VADAPVADAPAQEPAEPAKTPALDSPFIAQVRKRIVTANYGVSAGVGITLVERGTVDLLIFEASTAAEALQAASAALATVPDGEARTWRFSGSGPDLETGRYRAVIRLSEPPAAADTAAQA